MQTIKEAKEYLKQNYVKGVVCPCCNQNVKMYIRKINSGMVLFLIGLYKLHNKSPQEDYFDNKTVMAEMKINASSLDYSVLKHFKLIQEADKSIVGKRSSGLWRITQDGDEFVRGDLQIKGKVKLYNNKVYGFTGDFISIKDALGDKFNYSELMK